MARDNFPKPVLDLLFRRVGGRCSNPWCGRPTSGPSTSPDKAVSIGVGAHISAASRNGPRYDPKLTSEERRSADNGIWICHNCSDLIDKDSPLYTVQVIRGWKRIAEETARLKIERPEYLYADRSLKHGGSLVSQFPGLSDVIRIKGGKKLGGTVTVAGAKNVSSKMLIASLLTKQECTFDSIAPLTDTNTVLEAIEQLGGTVRRMQHSTKVRIDTSGIVESKIPSLRAFDHRSRINILLLAPLLHRFGRATVPAQGGCNLGDRKVDFHVDVINAMKGRCRTEHGVTVAEAPSSGLEGEIICLPKISVGATEQALFAGVLARGITTLQNAALVPEVLDLISLLNKMGASIAVNDARRELTIKGVEVMRGVEYTPMPDRSEVGSWACVSLATGAEIRVLNARLGDLIGLIEVYEQAGGRIATSEDGLVFKRARILKPIRVQTGAHPGFLTDWQPPLTAALTQARGTSVIHETVFNDRLRFVPMLQQMGASIDLHVECLGTVVCQYTPTDGKRYQHSAIISGPSRLTARDIQVDELRGGFASVIAGLIADGQTTIRNFSFLQKGYDNLLHKLLAIGADITPMDWLPSI